MQKNVGGYDRIARLGIGPVLVLVGIAALVGWISLATGTLGVAIAALAIVVGAVLLVTALTRVCFVNSLLGIDTFRGDGEIGDDPSLEEEGRAGRPS